MAIELVFETHSWTLDSELGRATGWLPGQLSEQGRAQAQQLGRRRLDDGITAVGSSDLARAAQTASAAFGTSAVPMLYDCRLRECDYGQRNGMPWPSCMLGVANTWTTLTQEAKAGGRQSSAPAVPH